MTGLPPAVQASVLSGLTTSTFASPPWAAPTAVTAVVQGGVASGGVFVRGGAVPYGYPPINNTPLEHDLHHLPPLGVVVGAGAVGALAGHLIFHSLVMSVGLGVGAMGVAASSDGRAGEIARSSGRMAQATFERTVELNERYHLTNKVADSFKSAGRGLREFDEEHAVVHKATEGIKDAWKGVRQFDETHQLTTRAGNAVSSGLDKLARVLEPATPIPASPEPSWSSSYRQETKQSRGGDHVSNTRDGGRGGANNGWHQKRSSTRRRTEDSAVGQNIGRQDRDGHYLRPQHSEQRDQALRGEGRGNDSTPPWRSTDREGLLGQEENDIGDWWGEDEDPDRG